MVVLVEFCSFSDVDLFCIFMDFQRRSKHTGPLIMFASGVFIFHVDSFVLSF